MVVAPPGSGVFGAWTDRNSPDRRPREAFTPPRHGRTSAPVPGREGVGPRHNGIMFAYGDEAGGEDQVSDDAFEELPESRTHVQATLETLLSAELTTPGAPRGAGLGGAAPGRQPRPPGQHRAPRSSTPPLLRSRAAVLIEAWAIVLGCIVTAGYGLIAAPQPGTKANQSAHGSTEQSGTGNTTATDLVTPSSTSTPPTTGPNRRVAPIGSTSRATSPPQTSSTPSTSASPIPTTTKSRRTGRPTAPPGHTKPTPTPTLTP
jgi:hypothetical protein